MKKKTSDRLNVVKVIEDFHREEKSAAHRNGTFKIDAPFEKAIDTIIKAKPAPKKSSK